jgi:hypothetical protein
MPWQTKAQYADCVPVLEDGRSSSLRGGDGRLRAPLCLADACVLPFAGNEDDVDTAAVFPDLEVEAEYSSETLADVY